MHLVIIAAVVLAVVFLPGIWVQRVMKKYSTPDDRYPGTGGQLARHLLDGLGLGDVGVEVAEKGGDHYDPVTRTVRLTPDKLDSRSLTAITVAAHEVGHAHQHANGFGPLIWRTRLVRIMAPAERLGALCLMAAPFITMVTRVPVSGLLTFFGGFMLMGLSTVVHLVTLPTEMDASFVRALPMLERGEVLRSGDAPPARRLLTAAALTYVAASLMSLLNVARWWALVRR
jgi:Zn-dependent membrane protease YugP